MALDVFDIKLGTDKVPYPIDDEVRGILAVQMLDAVQTVVDVLTDNDGQGGWKVTFDPGINAYTDRSANRHIVVSGKPLLDAKPGDPLAKVAAIMTGFAVHEVGHTKINFYEAIVKRWPGKQLPITLGNIIEDVVLEAQTVRRYAGFADQGEGNIFYPTLEWVAKATCPTTPLEWAGSTGHKVNITGQIVRYRPFVTFASDAATQDALAWVEAWAQRITADLTPSGCVELIEEWLDYVKSDGADPAPPKPPTPPTTECEFPFGENKTPTQSIPDEDDDEPKEPKGSGGGDEAGDDEPTDDGGNTTDGGDEPGDDGGNTTDGGDDDGEGKGDGPTDTEGGEGRDGDGNDADTTNRETAKQGTNDGPGGGGTGQSVSEAGEDKGDPDPDHGFNLDEVNDSFDDMSKVGEDYGAQGQQRRLDVAEKTERSTVRMDAGAFGKMRVIWK